MLSLSKHGVGFFNGLRSSVPSDRSLLAAYSRSEPSSQSSSSPARHPSGIGSGAGDLAAGLSSEAGRHTIADSLPSFCASRADESRPAPVLS
jgi:hypothetical protein